MWPGSSPSTLIFLLDYLLPLDTKLKIIFIFWPKVLCLRVLSLYLRLLYITVNFYFIMEERLIYSEIPNIQAYACILGLSFPETATEFQRACLTLAHLYATIRDYVLKGLEVPQELILLADQLNSISYSERGKQR